MHFIRPLYAMLYVFCIQSISLTKLKHLCRCHLNLLWSADESINTYRWNIEQCQIRKKFNKSHQTRLSASHKHARSVGSDTTKNPLYSQKFRKTIEALSVWVASLTLPVFQLSTLAEKGHLHVLFVFERITLSSLFITIIKYQCLSVCPQVEFFSVNFVYTPLILRRYRFLKYLIIYLIYKTIQVE